MRAMIWQAPLRKAAIWLSCFVLTALLADVLVRIALVKLEIPGDGNVGWRRRWVARHRQGSDIYYAFDQYDRTKGWIARPSLCEVKVFGNKRVSTNSLGLRGRLEIPLTKSPGTTRVLILGDSFTFGDEVSDDETFPHYLQELNPDLEVLNFGVHGYGHDQMLLLLKELGLPHDPDVVVLGFVFHDMDRNLLYFRDFAKPRFTVTKGRLELRNSPVPTPREVMRREWLRRGLWDLIEGTTWTIRRQTGQLHQESTRLSEAILREIQRLAEDAGALPVFVYLPILESDLRSASSLAEGFLFAFCEKYEATCFSVRRDFDRAAAAGIQLHFAMEDEAATPGSTIESHWTPAGHRVVASSLSTFLRSLDFVGTAAHSGPAAGASTGGRQD